MTKDPQSIIENCRQDISLIDQEIFSLIKKREQLSAKIGEAKRGLDKPDRDFAREKAVFDNAIAMAQRLELSESFATALQKLIIENSLSRQERDRIKKSSSNDSMSVLVIGGAGRMGQWLLNFFADCGHKVSLIDKINPGLPYPFSTYLDEQADQYDLIVVATPIRVSVEILEKLGRLNIKKPVVFDVSSVKTPVQKALTTLSKQGIKVSSLHPMFGPSVQLLFGKHIIITSLGIKEADDLAKSLFKATSLRLIDMGLEEHDRMMSSLLSLSHLVNIAFGAALHKSGIDVSFLEKLASPTFVSMLTMARRVFDENPHLYYEIQALNPHNKECYNALSSSLSEIIEAVNALKEHEFVAIMKGAQTHLSREN